MVLQQGILRLLSHLLCLVYNINLIIAAVRPYHNRVIDLLSDIIHTNAARFLMLYINKSG